VSCERCEAVVLVCSRNSIRTEKKEESTIMSGPSLNHTLLLEMIGESLPHTSIRSTIAMKRVQDDPVFHTLTDDEKLAFLRGYLAGMEHTGYVCEKKKITFNYFFFLKKKEMIPFRPPRPFSHQCSQILYDMSVNPTFVADSIFT
jgi:hypothetical protein